MSESVEELLAEVIDSRVHMINTMIPGIVESFNERDMTVDVVLCIKRVNDQGIEEEYPKLIDVPVLYPRSANFGLYFPLKKGDGVELRFSQRDVSQYLSTGSSVKPATSRRFNLSDAVASPGLFPLSSKMTVANKKAICISSKNSHIEITDTSTIIECGMKLTVTKDSVKIGDSFEVFATDQP